MGIMRRQSKAKTKGGIIKSFFFRDRGGGGGGDGRWDYYIEKKQIKLGECYAELFFRDQGVVEGGGNIASSKQKKLGGCCRELFFRDQGVGRIMQLRVDGGESPRKRLGGLC